MKLKYILSLLAIVAISKSTFAQYANDAVRFSTGQAGSTSRIKAVGGASTAIGGDISNISSNPAGLGYFTRSEFSITPEYTSGKFNTNYFGTMNNTNKNNGNVANVGAVFYTRLNTTRGTDKGQGWLSLNFGASYSRTNNFNENIYYNGRNTKNSITDYYASLATSGGIDNGLGGWAYDHNLIDRPSASSNAYDGNALPNVNQVNSISRTGGLAEVNLALGANYSNRLYLGLGLAITDVEYQSSNVFGETGVAQIIEGTPPALVNRNFNSTYGQYQTTKGSGVNLKLGMIYKIDDALRFGASFTSPTYISIDDVYSERLNTSFTGGSSFADGPADYPFSYNITTPFKASAGLSYFFKQYGFITGDVEFVDYGMTRLSGDGQNWSFDNDQIKANYRSVVNTRVGAEIRPIPALALRGGYSVLEAPAKINQASTKITSGGLGYRFGSYYVDATYQHISGRHNITPYTVAAVNDTPLAGVNRTNNNFFLTFGFRY